MECRTLRFVVTFFTTEAAMEMESACREAGVPGRLLPLPRAVSAGCGLCWAAPAEDRRAVEDLLVSRRLKPGGLYEIWM